MPPKNKNNQSTVRVVDVPKLDDDGANYFNWKLRTQKWCLISKVPISERALSIQCGLVGDAFEVTEHITVEDLQSKDGVKILLEALDEFYIPDKLRHRIEVFDKFSTHRRNDDTCIIEHIQKFMKMFKEYKSLTTTPYDDSTLALQLFTSCNMSEEDKKIVSAQMEEPPSSKNVSNILKRVFSSSRKINRAVNQDTVNQDTEDSHATLYARHNRRGSTNQTPRNNRRAVPYNNHYNRPKPNDQDFNKSRPNVRDHDGRILECHFCGSTNHFQRDCDNYKKAKNKYIENLVHRDHEVNFSL